MPIGDHTTQYDRLIITLKLGNFHLFNIAQHGITIISLVSDLYPSEVN